MEEEQIKKIKTIRNRIIIFVVILEIIAYIGIVMLLIDAGSSSGKTTCMSQMGQQEKEIYNSNVLRYISDSQKGSDVKRMIQDVISQNNQNVGEMGKFISIYAEDIKSYTRREELSEVNKKANVYEDKNGDNTQSNIDKATEEYRKLAQKISSGKEYKVEAKYEDGIIYKVIITELEDRKETVKGGNKKR